MTGFENHAGFTITDSKLQVVELIYNGSQFILENVDEAYFSEQINFEKDKETKISALLQGAFNELQIKKLLKSTSVSFTLPFDLFHIMQVPYDNTLLHQDLIEEFRWEFSVLYPFIKIDNLVIQYIEIDKNNIYEQSSALVIAIQRKYLDMIHEFAVHNNLNLKFIDNVHLASEKALAVSNSLMEKGLILSVYFNNKHLSLIFSMQGKPFYFKNFPLKGAGEIPSIIRNEITENQHLKVSKNSIDTAFITGDNITDSVVQILRKALDLDFYYFNPFDKIKPNPILYENNCYTEKNNSFSPAAGIAFRLA